MISTLIVANHEANIAVPATMLYNGASIQVAEINVTGNFGANQQRKTARFWVHVGQSKDGKPTVAVTANAADSLKQKSKRVLGTYLDLQARRAEKGLPPEARR